MSDGSETEAPARRPPSGGDLAGRSWVDRRTGIETYFGETLRERKLPRSANSWLALGGVLLFAVALQFATGALLLAHFRASPDAAFDSIQTIMRDVPFGWFVRLVHAHGANLIVLLLFVHLYRTAFVGAYRRPRELVWVSGYLVFCLLLAAALTGYILPWSQTSYWATTIVTSTLQYFPIVGDEFIHWVRGGELVGTPTYLRAFAAHVAILPMLMVLGIIVHLALVRRVGLMRANGEGDGELTATTPEAERDWVGWIPHFATREAISIVAFLVVLILGVFYAPSLYFPNGSFEPADPFDTPSEIRPEWYFLWAYQLPRLLPAPVALALQGLSFTIFLALPFLDRSGEPRRGVKLALAVSLVAVLVLTVLGARA